MEMRSLGGSSLKAAPLALGGNVFGWTADEKASFEVLDAFVGAGFNLIDTADIYSRWIPGHKGGESETIIGKWMKERGNRKKVLIATKVGKEMGAGLKGLSRRYIERAVEESLKRLQTDYIDLYQSHEDDDTTPLAETMEAFSQLIKRGKVRAVGASNYTGERLVEALRVSKQAGLPRYESVQPEYNLYDRAGYESYLEPVCKKEGLGVITYFSLASGFLSGKYRSEADLSKSARGAAAGKYLNPRGFKILAALDKAAAQYGTSPASIALAWVMARPTVTAPISSATSVEQLKQLVSAAALKLDSSTIQMLDEASAY